MADSERPDVYKYSDYRAYLGDLCSCAKEHEYGFSLRAFAKRAGTRSFNYLNLVIAGERNLSDEMAARFAKGCGLSGSRADFFCDLVAYGQAKTTVERHRVYRRLQRYREFRAVNKLDKAQAEYHSNWYVPAIRELAQRSDFVADPAWIAPRLLPKISTADAARALSLLQELGLLEVDENGGATPTQPLLTTGTGPLGHHIFNFHHQMLERAGAALDALPREERQVSCLTLCVSEERMFELMDRVREFRTELLQLAELEDRAERVVQINFQLFPLTAEPKTPPRPRGRTRKEKR